MKLSSTARNLRSFIRRRHPGHIPLAKMRPFLTPNAVFVEAGAHMGIDTVALAAYWPEGVVHAFEPVPALFEQLSRRASGTSNVRTYSLAIGAVPGRSMLHVSSGASDGSSSLFTPKRIRNVHPDVLFTEQVEIETVSLASWQASHGIGRVDALWLDLQGAELDALRGAGPLLDGVRVIHSEVNLEEAYEGAVLYGELRAWLAEQGFRVEVEAIPWADGGNVLFVKESQ